MALNPEMRASDADRDRVAAALREHCAQGRIDIEELGERIESVYAARTLGELQRVTDDLPEEDLYELPVPAWRRSTPARGMGGGLDLSGRHAIWAICAAADVVIVGVWLLVAVLTGIGFPWGLWIAGAWGVATLVAQLRRRDEHG